MQQSSDDDEGDYDGCSCGNCGRDGGEYGLSDAMAMFLGATGGFGGMAAPRYGEAFGVFGSQQARAQSRARARAQARIEARAEASGGASSYGEPYKRYVPPVQKLKSFNVKKGEASIDYCGRRVPESLFKKNMPGDGGGVAYAKMEQSFANAIYSRLKRELNALTKEPPLKSLGKKFTLEVTQLSHKKSGLDSSPLMKWMKDMKNALGTNWEGVSVFSFGMSVKDREVRDWRTNKVTSGGTGLKIDITIVSWYPEAGKPFPPKAIVGDDDDAARPAGSVDCPECGWGLTKESLIFCEMCQMYAVPSSSTMFQSNESLRNMVRQVVPSPSWTQIGGEITVHPILLPAFLGSDQRRHSLHDKVSDPLQKEKVAEQTVCYRKHNLGLNPIVSALIDTSVYSMTEEKRTGSNKSFSNKRFNCELTSLCSADSKTSYVHVSEMGAIKKEIDKPANNALYQNDRMEARVLQVLRDHCRTYSVTCSSFFFLFMPVSLISIYCPLSALSDTT
jgi:hypothetical protein